MLQLINPLILWGLGLAAIPVVLHLLFRGRPKSHLFPALRLVTVRKRHNARRLRLRHLWLLLLRMMLIGLVVFALARPKLPAADFWPQWPYEILALAGIVAVSVGVYMAVMRSWRRRSWPGHRLATRRTLLRGGTSAMALVLLAAWVLLMYRPRVTAEMTRPTSATSRNLPVTAVLVIDTSLSMQYRHENRTRLELARQIALDHVGRLPPGSEIAVIDTSVHQDNADDDDAWVPFQISQAAIEQRIDQFELHPVSRSLNSCVHSAVQRLDSDRGDGREGSDDSVREIYVFTDVARSAWSTAEADSRRLRDELAKQGWLGGLYIVDVGAANPLNVGLASLELSRHTVPEGGAVTIRATVDAVGLDDVQKRTVELVLRGRDGQPIPRGSQQVELKPGAGATVEFLADRLEAPFVQGELRLRSSDPLDVDDSVFFTVGVAPPPTVLLVSPTESEAVYLKEALAPVQQVRNGRARYRCRWLPASRLDDAELDDVEVVCLLNVNAPGEAAWQMLGRFVADGGGLAVVCGSSVHWQASGINPVAYNTAEAREILPATLDVSSKHTPPEFLDIRGVTHPAFKVFSDVGSSGDLALWGVRRYWKVNTAADARVIVTFTDSDATAAFIERPHGRGRTIMVTTALDLRWRWSDLPRADWFVILADRLVGYLAQRFKNPLTYTAGTGLAVRLYPETAVRNFAVVTPNGSQFPQLAAGNGRVLSIRHVDELGHFQVTGSGENTSYAAGFSINLSAAERDLSRLSDDELDALFGKGRYSISRNLDQLERNVGETRVGREVVPLLLLLVLIIFCGEHLVANRFYEADQAVAA